MSVRGEYRRLTGELVSTLSEISAPLGTASRLALQLERADDDLEGAAHATLELLEDLQVPADESDLPHQRERFVEAYGRLEAVCRIILGLPSGG